MVEDRFYEPTGYRDTEEMTKESYEEYLGEMQDQDGEPMCYEDFKDYYWRY